MVVDGEASLLVDTLYDLAITAEMRGHAAAPTTAAVDIDVVVNTHANGDHCWAISWCGVRKSSAPAVVPRRWRSAAVVLAQVMADPPEGPTGDLLRRMFGAFDFRDIEIVPPTTTFDGELTLQVGDTEVRLIEVGPAHTRGDVIVHLPAQQVVFTGDILFNGGHPIVWAGPVANWGAACDRIIDLRPATVVPGHGPVCDTGAVADERDYFVFLEREATARAAAGMTPLEAARDIELGGYARLGERERSCQRRGRVPRPRHPEADDALAMLGEMAAFGPG